MPWSTSRPAGAGVQAKYRSKEHREAVKRHRAALEAAGSGTCAEIICIKRSRLILPSMDLHLCHERSTGRVLGLGHAECNKSEAGRAARARQTASRLRW
jgi:hypothetical protein